MSEIRSRPISEADVEGFHRCLDVVSREQRFPPLLQAPPLEATRPGFNDAGQFGME